MIDRRSLVTAAALASTALLGCGRSARAATPWDKWQDLLNFRPNAAPLVQERQRRERQGASDPTYDIQRIEEATSELINFDFYGVQIAAMPTHASAPNSPIELLVHIRRNLGEFVDHELGTLHGIDQQDADDWRNETRAPLGALMYFKIPKWYVFHEEAAVVVSHSAADNWIFSPVTVPRQKTGRWSGPGAHPITGNRQFGITRQRGGFLIYARAVDRVLRSKDMVVVSDADVFKGAEDLWRSFQRNVAFFIDSTGGKAGIIPPTILQPQWSDVRDSDLWRRPP
jgi:hypothetical protein